MTTIFWRNAHPSGVRHHVPAPCHGGLTESASKQRGPIHDAGNWPPGARVADRHTRLRRARSPVARRDQHDRAAYRSRTVILMAAVPDESEDCPDVQGRNTR